MSVAQLVELLVVVQAVAGSNPVAHPSAKLPLIRGFALYGGTGSLNPRT